MTTVARDATQAADERPNPWVGRVAPSPAGPVDSLDGLTKPPRVALPMLAQTLRLSVRQAEFVSRANRELGEVFGMRTLIQTQGSYVTSHPDHVRSLFTAKPSDAPSITGESPLRPIVGPNSTLTALGARHMRQRKLMLPPFHGEAIARYITMIEAATAKELDRWPVGEPFALAPRMQAITLDVIMAGIFGIEGSPAKGTPERGLRTATKQILGASTMPLAQVAELTNVGKDEPVGLTRLFLDHLDRHAYAVIRARREQGDLDDRQDILSILLQARTEEGELLTDQELRDELLTLVLAGHETTANQLSWTLERLVRTPEAYERVREAVRGGGERAEELVEAAIHEGMRIRPVIPMIGRRVMKPWQLGEHGIPADRPLLMSILLLHHREDLYPDPASFRIDRFLGHKPGTYEWIPFGGGIRRCLGAALAMAEMRVVLREVMRRCDLVADRPEAEHALHRNVTMIPGRGARVVITQKR